MTEEQASVEYWKAVAILQEVIDSGQRDGKADILEELEDDLS